MLRYPPQPVSPIAGTRSKSSGEIFSWAFRCRRNTILFLLVGQITLSALLMRYSRTNHREDAGPKYRASVAVLATEMLKLPICLALATFTLGSPRRLVTLLRSDLPTYSTLKCAIPAFAYTIQSNLIFVATANLETPTFQVTYQTKTLFTALFSVLLLQRRLVFSQWMALGLLFLGTLAATDLSSQPPPPPPPPPPWVPKHVHRRQKGFVSDDFSHPTAHAEAAAAAAAQATRDSPVLGLTCVLIAALLSSASSVYFEMMLKKEPVLYYRDDRAVSARGGGGAESGGESGGGGGGGGGGGESGGGGGVEGDIALWLRNLQLSLFALPLAAAAAVVQDGRHIARVGAFAGFDRVVWSVVLINGVGGLLVAATMKYADNIVKCFATALAIIFGTFLSVPIFGFEFSRAFLVGAGLTVFASTLYAWAPVYGSERGTDAKPGLEERSELLTHEHSPAIDPLSDGAELKSSAPASTS
jgi:UDP-sugar transporter A1/2/3